MAATGLSTNGATIADKAGNVLSPSLTGLSQTGPQVDTVIPVVSGVSASPSAGDLNAGKTVAITLAMNKPVTVTGAPTLSLNDGGTATYDPVNSTATALVFDYTVASGQNTASLGVTKVNLPAGTTILDAAGNAATLTGAVATFTGLEIDTVIPAVTGVTASPATADLDAGKTVTLTVALSEAVSVSGGTPTLSLNDGGTATYQSGSGTKSLVFSYTVQPGDNTPDLAISGYALNGALIQDAAGNNANLAGVVTNPAGTLQIDTVTPIITSVTESPSSGDLKAGSVVTFTLATAAPVYVSGGTPSLTLNDGGTATYKSGSGTAALTFSYTVAAGQDALDLAATGLSTNGATIADKAGNVLSPSLTGLSQTGPQVDTVIPVVSGVSASPAAGDLKAGKTVAITLAMNKPVTVTGAPTLSLNDGGTATYDPVNSTATALVFDYTVASGQNTASLGVTKVNLPAGTTILDAAGNAATLAGAVTSFAGLQIDTLTPAVTKVSALPASGTVTTGNTVAITLAFNEAVTVTGTPALLLNDGGTATYSAANSTPTSLVFDYSVPSNQGTTSLAVIGIELQAPGTITDGAGNIASLSKAAATLGVKINSIVTPPAPVNISGTTDTEIFGASSQNVTFSPGATGTLQLDTAQSFTGNVSGLTASDTIDLPNLTYGANMTVGYSGNASSGQLTIGNATQTAKINLLGNYLSSTFTLGSDGHGGTTVVDPPQVTAVNIVQNPKGLQG